MISIAKNDVDWVAIRNEYISGGISQRKIAQKYGVTESKVMRIARREKWAELRNIVRSKSEAKAVQIIAAQKAKNAATKERVIGKVYIAAEKAIDAIIDSAKSTEIQEKEFIYCGDKKIKEISHKTDLRDITSCLKDISDEEIRREKLDLDKKRAEDDW